MVSEEESKKMSKAYRLTLFLWVRSGVESLNLGTI